MRRETDRTYYLERAEAELECARSAINSVSGRAHFVLAGFYFDRAFRESDEKTLPVALPQRINPNRA